LLIGLSAVLAACVQDDRQTTTATETPAVKEVQAQNTASAQTISESAMELGARAAHWQLTHLDNFDYIPERNREKTSDPREWMQAAFYVGLTHWADTVDDQRLVKHIAQTTKENDYQLGARPMHGDDHAIGQTYLWVYEQTGNPAAFRPIGAVGQHANLLSATSFL
jgi:hypothetical protein